VSSSGDAVAPPCRQTRAAPFREVRLIALVGLIGIWQAAASLGAPLAVTALFTLGAAALGAWAVAVLRAE
jgi:hypothetical protein